MSKLEDISAPFRKVLIAKNDFNQNEQYTAGHPDSLSTGDENGKGEQNGEVGGATDIKVRKTLMTKNKYSRNKEYNAGTA